jgi:hypothetical protein
MLAALMAIVTGQLRPASTVKGVSSLQCHFIAVYHFGVMSHDCCESSLSQIDGGIGGH